MGDEAWEFAEVGNYDLALKTIKRAIDANIGNPVLWNDQGLFALELGKLDLADESFKAAMTLAPTYADPVFNLAKLMIRVGEIEESITLYETACRLEPDNERYRNELTAVRDSFRR